MGFPLLAQELERALGQRHVTVLIAFAGADVQEHAFGIDVADLEPQAFAQTQAAGVDGGQADPVVQGGNVSQDAAHFTGGEDDWQFELGIGAGQFHFVGPGAAEGLFPEDLDRADGLGAGLASYLFVLLEMDAVLSEVFGREQVWGFVVMLAELAEASVVGLLGARADRQELQVIGEGI